MSGKQMVSAATWLIAFGLVAGPGASKCRAEQARVVTVTRGDLYTTVSLPGLLQSTSRSEVVAPDVPGISRLEVVSVVEEGQRIKPGDTLVVFAAETIQQRVRQAQEQLDLARASMALRERQFEAERIDRILAVKRRQLDAKRASLMTVKGVGLVPALQYEKAELDRQAARMRLKKARQELSAFDERVSAALQVDHQKVQQATQVLQLHLKDLRELVLTATEAGMVQKPLVQARGGRAQLEVGHQVRPGARLLRLVDTGSLQAHLCSRAEPGDEMAPGREMKLIVVGLPGAGQSGVIQGIQAGCRHLKGKIGGQGRGWTVLVKPGRLPERWWPGQRVIGSTRVRLARNVLRLPTEAIANRNGRAYVHLIEGGGPVSRPVDVGGMGDGWAEIVKGLKEADQVMVQH